MSPIKGYQLIVLHAHLPYVRHKGYNPAFLEENWLNEAISETYLPLLKVFRNLKKENIHFIILNVEFGLLHNFVTYGYSFCNC